MPLEPCLAEIQPITKSRQRIRHRWICWKTCQNLTISRFPNSCEICTVH